MATVGFMVPQKHGPFTAPATFMNLPFSAEPEGALAAILGAPFDCGMHPTRIGARQGPASIREQSGLLSPYQPPHAAFNPLELLNAIDCGDADVTSSLIEDSFEQIEAAAWRIVSAGAAPVALGGDGAVSLPLMRAAKRRFPDLCVLHVDAHTDTYRGDGNATHHRYNVATTFTRAAEEGAVDAANSFHVGPRGPVSEGDVFEHTRQQGYRLIPGREMFDQGLAATAAALRAALAGRPVHLCFDMDFFDPSCAPRSMQAVLRPPTWLACLTASPITRFQARSRRKCSTQCGPARARPITSSKPEASNRSPIPRRSKPWSTRSSPPIRRRSPSTSRVRTS